MEWLMASISGSSTHTLAPWAMWHARWMVLAWGVLLPVGALVARFFKVLPAQNWPQVVDNTLWWHTHRALQWAGFACLLVGLWLVWGKATGRGDLPRLHGWVGWLVCVLAALQVLGALARGSKGGPTDHTIRGDHYDMTSRRRVFERLHKGLGWLAVLLAVVVMALGLTLADAGRRAPLDGDCSGCLVACVVGSFCVSATRRPLCRHLPGDLGPRCASPR